MASPAAQCAQLLLAAASGDARVRVPAQERLQELESRPGFVPVLLEAYADASIEPQGRYLAVLMCKNVVDRQWQPRAGTSIAPEEKHLVKERLLQLVKVATEGQLPHLVELTMVLRRVCRFDFPMNWDGLAHFLLAELKAQRERGFSESALAVVLVLHQVLKEQSTKRLLAARHEFHQLGPLLVEPLGGVWALKMEHLRQLKTQGSIVEDRVWRLSRHLDGSFLLLLVHGFAHLHEQPTGPQMIQMVKEEVESLLALLQSHSQQLIQCPFFLKNLKSVLKWWALLFHAHPLAFAHADVCGVLHCSVEVLRTLTGLQVPHEMRPWLEGVLRSQLLMLSHGFNTVSFRKGPQPSHQGPALEAAQACHQQFGEFVRQHPVAELCELASRAALKLPQEEVQEWLQEPEDQLLGPQCQTELHQAGEACIKALGQAPLDEPLVKHIAQRMQEESQSPVSPKDPFEVVVRKDMLLSLLALCHSQLLPHLQFQVMLAAFAPIAQLLPHLSRSSGCCAVLLPVRLCSVLRAWASDIPNDCLMSVLQLLQAFLSAESPKAVRLAALSPVRVLLERFSDHEAWTQVQSNLIDSTLALLSIVSSPEIQWRCLNLVNLFLVEEAESGRYQVTERTMQQLLELWRRPEEGEFLIRHALLDVLRALVLMSCRSRSPRLPLSPPLLSCCLTVISDCYAVHRGQSNSGYEASAALQADAESAAGALGDQGSASGSLFDSGSALFLGVLRTVELEQAAPLMPFFPKLLAQQASLQGPPAEWTMEILLEYCALHCSGGAASHLLQFYPPLLQICQTQLQAASSASTRTTEMSLQLLQLLLAHAPNAEALQKTKEVVVPLCRWWATTFDPWATKSAFAYPITTFLGILGAWHACHPGDFTEQVSAFGHPKLSVLLAACCKQARSISLRSSVISAALTLAESGVEEQFWREVMNGCNELILAANQRGISSALAKTLQSLKASLSVKLPAPARSFAELQLCLLPAELKQSHLKEDGSIEDATIARWLFSWMAVWLKQLGGTRPEQLQVLLSSAPEQVQDALRSSGL